MKNKTDSETIEVGSAFESVHTNAAADQGDASQSVPLSMKAENAQPQKSGNRKAVAWAGAGLASMILCGIGAFYFWPSAEEPMPIVSATALPSLPKVEIPEVKKASTGGISADKSYFAFRSAVLSQADKTELLKSAQHLRANPNASIRVAGYADEIGGASYNLKLSHRRATAAALYLEANGVSKSQIKVIAFGESRPAKLGKKESARKWNRRVEITEIKKPLAATAKR